MSEKTSDECRAFPDCNILLHFKSLEQIPWDEILGTKNVVIVISMSLWRELGKKKYDGSMGVKARAADRSRWLTGRWKAGSLLLSGGAQLFFAKGEHGLDMAAEGLDPRHADDDLLAEVIASSRRLPEIHHVLVTDDGGLEVLAEGKGLVTIGLPESLNQPIDDQATKELRQAKQELDRLKNRVPRLVFEFEGGGSTLEVRLPPPTLLPESEIQERLNHARKANPPMNPPDPRDEEFGAIYAAATAMYPRVSAEQVMKYNAHLNGYFEALEKYLRNGNRNDPRCIALPIRLANRGRGPAVRLRITLHFSSDVFASEHDFGPGGEPQPPKKPTPADLFVPQPFADFRHLDALRIPGFNRGPAFDSDRRIVSYRIDDLDQHLHLELDLFGFFAKKPVHSFRVDCEVTTPSIPERQAHSLNVHVVRDEREDSKPEPRK